MRRVLYTSAVAAITASVFLLCGEQADAQTRLHSAQPSRKPFYPPEPQISRNGVTMRPSPLRHTTNYVVPNGGYYYYGWSPGGYYYSNRYYSSGYYPYACPYCGVWGCYGACRGPIYYPPVVADAGALFGPRSVQQVMGLGGGGSNVAAGNVSPLRVAQAQAPPVPPRLSNPTVRARAWKFVEYGDRHFKKGDYRQAAERYHKAESQAPDIPAIYFREGFAELGAGRYAEAVVAIRAGLQLEPDWPSSGFVLEELYPAPEAKRAVFRQLHTYLEDHPHDADATFLLAVLQHFDGETAAAEVGFRHVVELLGVAPHAMAFLPMEPQVAEEANPVEKVDE